MIGTKLAHYEITSHLGSGGMGDVYQATDTKLGRSVAIKFLPEAFSHDTERVARFQREARVLASLNHPNIAAIHGVEEIDARHFLVMELVAGETLADRIKSGATPIEEALHIAKQIAEALEEAHEKGIIHRDLKPANIKVTPEGKVKVLDFGLAKAYEREQADVSASNSPTLSMAATQQGVILGTAAYMSPEQARGKTVSKATDIWAFGAVLYELLAGAQPFHGEDVTDILAAVVRAEPDWSKLPRETPPAIRTLLKRCLRKDRQQRLQDAATLRIEIEDVLSDAAPAEPARSSSARAPVRQALLPVLVGLVLGALIAGILTWNLKPAPPVAQQPVQRFTITLPPDQVLTALNQPAVALSPDGTRLAYVAMRDAVQQVYVRSMDSLEIRPLPGTEGASSIFFSPDGEWLGFFAVALKKVSLSGGPTVTLVGVGTPRGASWADQHFIIFNDGQSTVLRKVSDAGGMPQPVTKTAQVDTSHRWPEILPGAILFSGGTTANSLIAVQSLISGERKNLTQAGTFPRYASSGHLLYAQGAELMAVPFDVQRLETVGPPVPVVQGVLARLSGVAQYSISRSGSLAYIPGRMQGIQRKLVWVNRNGKEQSLAAPARPYESPRLSPDGLKLAVSADGHIWLYDLSREVLTRLTVEGTANNRPVWAPDGKRIAFYSNRDGALNLYWQMANGSGGLERLTTADHTQVPHSFSPDGKFLAFMDVDPANGDARVLSVGDHKIQPLLQTPFRTTNPRFSPDGRWVAFESARSGRSEVYVRPYPGPGGEWQISVEGGTEAVWNPNGRELFYRDGEKMMAVEIVTQPDFSLSKPQMLFERAYASLNVGVPNYDVSPDGQRFLMIKDIDDEENAPARQINVVLNFTEDLKRRLPAGTK